MPLDRENNPLISVIIPTFNAARFLPDALASIRRQAYERLEIIVVDDGSTDSTRELLAGCSDIRYLHQQNQGVSAARNAGIRAARGDLLAFLDADDLWTPDHLRLLLPCLSADRRLAFVWGTARIVRLSEDADGNRAHESIGESVPMFLVGSGLYRPSAFTEVGFFDQTMRVGEDTDWLAAARKIAVPQKQIAETVLIYRKREGSLTYGNESFAASNTMNIVIRSIRRHRAIRQDC